MKVTAFWELHNLGLMSIDVVRLLLLLCAGLIIPS